MDGQQVQGFPDFLRQRIGRNWVLARRTQNILRRYGSDVVCLSQKQYDELELDYERATGRAAHGLPGEPSRFMVQAAPEMLEALKAAAEQRIGWARMVRKAIAAAEGR